MGSQNSDVRPTKKEQKALKPFFNRFYALYDEVTSNDFMKENPELRFYKIKELFFLYAEMTNYELIEKHLNWVKNGGRPIFDGIIADSLFSCIRNIFSHYPLFDNWDDVYMDKELATWHTKGSIDKFLSNCGKIKIDNKAQVKYRIWQYETKKMTYFSVNLDNDYRNNKKVFLRDIIPEDMGILFFAEMMKRIVDIAIENPPESKIDIMSQVYIAKDILRD